MLKTLKTLNRQSHEETELEFCSGLNIIIGSSHQGKTVIYSSLVAVVQNKLWGQNFIRRGSKEAKVILTTEEEREVKRRRTKSKNSYFLDNEKLEAFRTSVPPEIEKVLRMGPINFSGQHDGPFLLFDSPGTVSAYINELLGLEELDQMRKKISSNLNSDRLYLEGAVERIEDTEEELKEYEEIDEVNTLLNETKEAQEKSINYKIKIDHGTAYLETRKEATKAIENLTPILNLDKDISNLESLERDWQEIQVKLENLSKLLSIRKSSSSIVKNGKKIVELQDDIDSQSQLELNYVTSFSHWSSLDRLLKYREKTIASFTESQKAISKLRKQLPNICPTCGQEVEEWII